MRLAHDHAAHRHRARGDALGEGDHVGHDAVALGREGVAEPAEAGDDLVEDQQDAVLVADRAQPLQVALGRGQHAGRARHRLDDHGGDGRGVVQRDDALELVGEMRAPVRLALAEGLVLAVVGGRQVIDAGQQRAEEFAVVDDAADRNAAEADAVIAALAPDQAGARAFAAHVVIGERDLERGVDRLRAGVAEEHVIEIARARARRRGSRARTPSDARTETPAHSRARPPGRGSPPRSARDCARHWCTTARRCRRAPRGRRACSSACPWRGRSAAAPP